jgi:hypothetical protein
MTDPELAKRLLVLGDDEAKVTCMWGADEQIYPADKCPACGEWHHIPMSYGSNGLIYICPKIGWTVYGVYA